MSWHGIEGHDAIVEQFRRSLERGRLASTFLFVGPDGVGKRSFAFKLAQALLCSVNQERALDPCGRCQACQQVAAETHPDLDYVSVPAGKVVLPLELFIGDQQHRGREGLCRRIAMKPAAGGRRIAIVDDADLMNVESANCLLKILEEPPPRSVLILLSTSVSRQLPTIRSRGQIIRFRPLDRQIVARLLLEKKFVDDPDEAARLAERSGGSVTRAVALLDPELREFRGQWLATLAHPQSKSWEAAASAQAFVTAGGKDAPARRERLRTVVEMTIDFHRLLQRGLLDLPISSDDALQRQIEKTLQVSDWDGTTIVDSLECCLAALQHIAANANVATLVDAWIDDLYQIRIRRPVRRV